MRMHSKSKWERTQHNIHEALTIVCYIATGQGQADAEPDALQPPRARAGGRGLRLLRKSMRLLSGQARGGQAAAASVGARAILPRREMRQAACGRAQQGSKCSRVEQDLQHVTVLL